MPMIAEEEARKPTFLGWTDKRKAGELLMPARFPKAIIDQEKITLGSSAFAGQMQQRPSPVGGDKFKREWWQYWRNPKDPWKVYPPRPRGTRVGNAIPLPEKFDAIWQTWDMAFKDGEKNDFVVGLTIGISGAYRFVLERRRARMSFTETKKQTKEMARKWNPTGILVEGKANGPAVINALSEEVPGIIDVNPEGGKESRAACMSRKPKRGTGCYRKTLHGLKSGSPSSGTSEGKARRPSRRGRSARSPSH
jgi:hypothetical protein